MQRPIAPSHEQKSLKGNGNKSKLWDQSHLRAVVKCLAENKFSDGLKFILGCQATHDIFKTMSFEAKIDFLQSHLS